MFNKYGSSIITNIDVFDIIYYFYDGKIRLVIFNSNWLFCDYCVPIIYHIIILNFLFRLKIYLYIYYLNLSQLLNYVFKLTSNLIEFITISLTINF